MQGSLGRYQLIDELGRGGMGVVYKAVDPRLERFVAIKCLSQELAGDERRVAAFLREARHAAALNHPNVAQIFNSDEWDGRPYLVMEYIDGDTLSSRLRQHGAITPATAAAYAVQAAEALNAALEQKIIHQDVKPSNIMADKKGRVVLTDFGIARVLMDHGGEKTGPDLIGTPGYMAPELYRQQPADHRSDIFSLGMVLYEMLAGKPYFASQTPKDIVAAHAGKDFPDLSTLPLPEDNDLYRVLRKMLQVDPDHRYADYDVLLSDLRDAAVDGDAGIAAAQADSGYAPTVVVDESLTATATDASPGATRTIHTPPMHNRKVWLVASVAGVLLTTAVAVGRISPGFGEGLLENLWPGDSSESGRTGLVSNPQETESISQPESEPAPELEPEYASTGNPRAMSVTVEDEMSTSPAPVPQRSALDILKEQRALAANNDSRDETGGNDQTGVVSTDVVQTTAAGPDQRSSEAVQQRTESAPAPAVVAELAKPDGIMVIDVGDRALAGPIRSTLESGLRSRGLELTDSGFVGGIYEYIFEDGVDLAGISDAATGAGVRYLVIAKVTPIGTQQLNYYGRQTTAYNAQVEITTYDLVNKRQLTSSPTQQVMYTSLNASDKARQAAQAAIPVIYGQFSGARG